MASIELNMTFEVERLKQYFLVPCFYILYSVKWLKLDLSNNTHSFKQTCFIYLLKQIPKKEKLKESQTYFYPGIEQMYYWHVTHYVVVAV